MFYGYDSSRIRRPCTVNSIEKLPPLFTYEQARHVGISKRELYRLRDQGVLTCLSRGIYARRGGPLVDLDLIEIVTRAPRATLCLTTALARHGLTDAIPTRLDIAIPRTARPHRTRAPVTWHRFDPNTFQIGRTELRLDALNRIGIYGPERCVIDAFRMRSVEGPELAHDALRRWLTRAGAQPAALLKLARAFPRTQRILRETLEVLL